MNIFKLKKMALAISLNQLNGGDEDKRFIQSSLELKCGDECFAINSTKTIVYLPLAWARINFEMPLKQDEIKKCDELQQRIELRPEQHMVKTQVEHLLRADGYAIISARPGFGKTVTAIALACEFNCKTLIVINKCVLANQWVDAIKLFSDSRVQFIQPKTVIDPKVNFYVINAINILKFDRTAFEQIEFLIVDELHQIVTKKSTMALLNIQPKMILGLSATPYRLDEYDTVIKWFFGDRVIGDQLNVAHSVYIVKTEFNPSTKFTSKGMDWNYILEQQSADNLRNELIVDSVSKRLDRTWIILVKRVVHAQLLVDKFKQRGIDTTTLLGSSVTFDKQCKILIGTTSKIGVGFDHAAIDALCVAADVKNYFVQFLGRCMRRADVKPIVLDFEDRLPTLKSHLNDRIKEYRKHGGIVFKDGGV